ncbi:hypothetical protein [Neobacillus sp. LXY-4]|uniref:hypothetical protein n=1 Tax=Neobacillus sp. LXY-4 TaxID=3379826 RepID=UPI003EE4101D
MQESIENKLKTVIENSGNSEVDLNVNIEIDTKALAYGLLCSLYAKGEITESELEKAVQKLDSLIDRDKKRNGKNMYIENKPNLFGFPKQNKRRKW